MPREADLETSQIPDRPSIPSLQFGPGRDNSTPFRVARGEMKRTKRISIEFQHREVTIAVAGSTLHVPDCEPDAASTAALCSICNSPWITIVAQTQGDGPSGVDHILPVLQQSGLHAQVSPAGQLRICQRSFVQLKEKF